MKKTCLMILMSLFAILCFAEMISGKVISVKDGDTLEILWKGQPLKIRLYAVDCPEKDQDFGTKAKMFTSGLAFAKIVKVDVKNKDMYGRSVAEVILPDGRSLNEELLKNGFAWHYKEYNQEEKLAEMENSARAAGKGLWSGRNPVEPWKFRKDKKSGIKNPEKPKMGKTQLNSGAFVASINSDKYHRSSCKWVKKIPKKNRRYFNKKSEAEAEQLKPCADCNP